MDAYLSKPVTTLLYLYYVHSTLQSPLIDSEVEACEEEERKDSCCEYGME